MTKTGWATLLAVAIPISALFGPVLCSDRSLAMRDAAHFYHPLFQWCAREWGAGRVPLWNPYENGGIPVLADASSSIFYPGKLLFLLPVDFAWRYKLYVVLHVVLAAATSYWLARAWKASAGGAALAAIAYSCGGNVVFQYCNVVFLVGAAWLPLAALFADRLLRQRSWQDALWLGATLALMILGGDPQAAYHGLLIAGLYAAILALSPAAGEAPSWSRRCAGFGLSIGWIGAAAVVGFLLAAIQILPSSEATKYSERAAFDDPRNLYEAARVMLGGGQQTSGKPPSVAKGLFGATSNRTHHDLVFDFSVGPWRLKEYIWPNIGGRMMPTNRRWMSLLPFEGRTWTPTLYLGLLPLLLALAGLRLRSGEARERWLTWLVLIFTLASFGWYGIGWIAQEVYALGRQENPQLGVGPHVGGVYWLMTTLLPTYIYFRYPAKLLPLVSLGLSQLAAIGWDRTVAQPRQRFAQSLFGLGLASGAAAFVIWCIGSITGLFLGNLPADASLGPFDREGAYYDILLALAQAAAVAFGGRWILMRVWNEPAKAAQWQAALLLLTSAELAIANRWLVISAPANVWRKESPAALTMKEPVATSSAGDVTLPPRFYRGALDAWRPPSLRQQGSANRPAEIAQWEHDTLFPKYQLASELSLLDSYGSIKLLDYDSLLLIAKSRSERPKDKSLLPHQLPHAAALRLLGAEYLLLPKWSEPAFANRIRDAGDGWPEDAVLWKMQRTQPRAWIVHNVVALPLLPRPGRLADADARTDEVLFPGNKARDFRHIAVVETDQPLPEWSAPPATGGEIAAEPCRFTHYDPQRVVVETQLAQPGLLVLSEAWYPGWQATVTTAGQTRDVPIYQTNRVLRGVWLPAGKHSVEFQFRPQSFVRGAWISGFSWLLIAAIALVLVNRGRRLTAVAN